MGPLIEVERLVRRYGQRVALAGVDFAVEPGEIVGLLGPNGAGKTTTLSILATLLRPDAGRVVVAGCRLPEESARARRALGLVPQDTAVYPPLGAVENLLFFARLYGLRGPEAKAAAERALRLVGLEERATEPVERFSSGMRRRLNLACGILHRPQVVLLDEPTVGVDPQSRERIFEAVTHLAAEGAAVLWSTHAMEEAERLCRRVVLLDRGRVVAAGTPAELVARSGSRPLLRLRMARAVRPDWLEGVGGARVVAAADSEVSVEVEDASAVPGVVGAAVRAGNEVLDVAFRPPNLADVFFQLTGRALRDEEVGS
jgi:ABC-2 type transport system ATP-binding protein